MEGKTPSLKFSHKLVEFPSWFSHSYDFEFCSGMNFPDDLESTLFSILRDLSISISILCYSKNKIFCLNHDLSVYVKKCSTVLDDNGNNIIWTLCHHGHVIKDSAYILEKLMNVLPEESLKNNLDLLLLSGVKVFLQSPAESQHILGRHHLRFE